MKAITYPSYGGPEVLTYGDAPDPKLAMDGVLVAVKAAAVNPVDWKVTAGYLDGALDAFFPAIPGWDVSGVVEDVGPGVTELEIGDEVYGYVRKDDVHGGTYAEKVTCHPRHLARRPTGVDFAAAAGIPLAGMTALQCLRALDVGEGDTVLVHAAAGGVGAFAVQIARARGARVIGTASETNHDFLRGLMVDPVTYGDGLVDRVRELAPNGVTAVLDTQGGDTLALTPELLADGSKGRVASIADPGVRELGGVYVFVRPSTSDLEELAVLANAGELKVEVDSTYALEDAAKAWEHAMGGHVRGKVLLTP